MAKVLLFNPPTPDRRAFTREGRCTQEAGVWATQWPPVTLATAAALLRADGHEVRVRDFPAAGQGLADLEALVAAFAPDLAAWSTGTPTLSDDLAVARRIKAFSPATVTAVLGTHVTALPEDALAEEDLDAVLRGEPEGILRELCRNLGRDWGRVAGISYRARRGAEPPGLGSAPADQDALALPAERPSPSVLSFAPETAMGGSIPCAASCPPGGIPRDAYGRDAGFRGMRPRLAGGENAHPPADRPREDAVSAAAVPERASDAPSPGPLPCLSGEALSPAPGGEADPGGAGAAPAIVHNPPAACLAPEAIPAPAWDALDLSPYRLPLKGRPFLIVAPVRGCPWRCSFCTAPLYYETRLRRRPVAAVLAEMEDDVQKFGVREFFVWADTFTADRSYVEAFCRAVSALRTPVAWTCNSRVDTVDKALLRLMAEAGCWMVSYGIESGDDAILARCGKGITASQSRRAVEEAREAGLRVAGHFIFGLPGETESSMGRTLAFALDLPLDIAQFYAAAPFPGTPLYDEARRQGWLRRPDGPPPAQGPADRSGAGPSQSGAAMDLPGLPASAVDAFRRRAYRRFYGRPRVLAHLLGMVEKPAVAHLFSQARRFFRWSA